jgi:hypothetical protein
MSSFWRKSKAIVYEMPAYVSEYIFSLHHTLSLLFNIFKTYDIPQPIDMLINGDYSLQLSGGHENAPFKLHASSPSMCVNHGCALKMHLFSIRFNFEKCFLIQNNYAGLKHYQCKNSVK